MYVLTLKRQTAQKLLPLKSHIPAKPRILQDVASVKLCILGGLGFHSTDATVMAKLCLRMQVRIKQTALVHPKGLPTVT